MRKHMWIMMVIVALLAVPAAAMEVVTNTYTFQQGLDGYAGCEDTLLLRSNGFANFGGDDDFYMGRVPWVESARGGLIRFNDIFGAGAAQVPSTAEITNATLYMYTKSASTSYYTRIFAMWSDWVEGHDPGSAGAMPEEGASCHYARRYRSDFDYAAHPEDAWGTDGGGATVAVFQQGFNGYTGCEDTVMHGNTAANEDNNFGADDDFYMGTYPTSSSARGGLIRFNNLFGTDPCQVPTTEPILKATLRLHTKSASTLGYVRLYPMWTDWVEGDSYNVPEEGASCHNARHYRSDGDYATYPADGWGTDGIEHDGPVKLVDYPDAYVATCDNAGAGVWMEFDITTTVQDWQDGTLTNYGLYGYCNSSSYEARFWSSEYDVDPCLRPQLVIVYGTMHDGPVRNVDFDFDNEVTHTDNPGAGVWMAFDVTSVVQDWHSGALDNNGVYGFNNNTGTESRFYSSEYADPALRPKLIIQCQAIDETLDDYTAIFKNGLNDYYGCRDTSLHGHHATAPMLNYGGANHNYFGGCPWLSAPQVGLICFDDIFGYADGQVPPDAEIEGASFRFWVYVNQNNDGGAKLQLWPMLTDWVEGNSLGTYEPGASCLQARHYRPDEDYPNHIEDGWGTAGATQWQPHADILRASRGPKRVYDYQDSERVYVPFDPCANPGWMDVDVTDIVELWRTGAVPNYGLYGLFQQFVLSHAVSFVGIQ